MRSEKENAALLGAGVRGQFPVLMQEKEGRRLVFLDSGASAQKPRVVLEAMQHFYETDYANIHRGVYALSARATARYESGRRAAARFLGAAHEDEIVFTRGATDGINLVASSWGKAFLKPGDEIVITALEHHANIVPWQFVRDELGAVLKVVPMQPSGEVLLEDVKAALSPRTKILAFAQVSNALGTILPAREMVRLAHAVGAVALVDGCQAVSHGPVDVQELDADFYVFSGHKLYGPTGIGVLYGKRALLKSMPPYQGGGDMIASVTFEKTLYQAPPARFEAGTPPIAEVIGLEAAIAFVEGLGREAIARHEAALLERMTERLSSVPGVHLVGTAPHKASILSFTIDGAHPHDVGTVLDHENVAVRAGHHCAQPALAALGLSATVRASLGLYNDNDDIDVFVDAVQKAKELLS